MIVEGEEVARFVSDRLDIGLCPPYVALGIERDGEIVAGTLFNHFEGADIHASIAGTGWTRAFIRAVGHYVFEQLECQRITAVTERPDIIDFALRLGGQVEGCLRNHFGYDRDGTVVGILKDEWKYGRVPLRLN